MNEAKDSYFKKRHEEAYDQISKAISKLHPKLQNSKGYLRFKGHLKFDKNLPDFPIEVSFKITEPKKNKKL